MSRTANTPCTLIPRDTRRPAEYLRPRRRAADWVTAPRSASSGLGKAVCGVFADTECPARGELVVGMCRVVVAGHVEQVGAYGMDAVMPGEGGVGFGGGQ